MSNFQSPGERLDAEAADWVVRLTSGEVTPEERVHFDAWRRQSPDHEAAFTFARQTWHELGQLRNVSITEVAAHRREGQPPPRRVAAGQMLLNPPRRVIPWRWLAVAAVVFLVLGLVAARTDPLMILWADHRTGVGETQVVTLPDGSTAHLNTHSALAVRFDGHERAVDVLRGEIAFTVANIDAAHPFVVRAGPVKARALGTQFVVRLQSTDTEVIGIEHRVAVSAAPTPGTERLAVVLDAGQAVHYRASTGLGPVRRVGLPGVTAWQRGRLIFDQVPLGSVIHELNRYRRGLIILADGDLAQRTVSGVFLLDHLDAGLDTIAAELRLKVRRFSPFLTVLN
jgi:transmembrane sensor